MPISSNRAWAGFAKAGAPTFLTAAVAAAATSLPVNGTVVPASSTVYIVDGPNSEIATVSAGGGSSTLTVGALAKAHPANTPIYWQLTASLGPAFYTPLTNIAPQDHVAFIPDMGVRGSNVDSYNQVAGAMYSEVQLDGDVFTDAFGFMLGSVYGAVDFSAGTPNTHTFAGMNTSASQRPADPDAAVHLQRHQRPALPGRQMLGRVDEVRRDNEPVVHVEVDVAVFDGCQ